MIVMFQSDVGINSFKLQVKVRNVAIILYKILQYSANKTKGVLVDRHRYMVSSQYTHQGPQFEASLIPLAADL